MNSLFIPVSKHFFSNEYENIDKESLIRYRHYIIKNNLKETISRLVYSFYSLLCSLSK